MASAIRLGGSGGSVELDPTAFGAPFNGPLVHECVRAELNARRQGTASSKTRGQVRGGSAKPWRQKGTGRARQGSTRAPHFAGGGAVFGPSPRHYTVKVNRKARRAAFRAALSVHAGRESVAVFDAGAFDAPATKRAVELLGGWERTGRVLLLLGDDEVSAGKSFRNLSRVTVLTADNAGVADVIGHGSLLLSDAALQSVTARAVGAVAEEASS
jgi:large subunit ribosomal protein L4